MLFSPEIDAMKEQMTAIIVRDSEGFFDDPKESESLQITVRVACEFFIFLQRSKDVPELGEAEYMAETIRSGMDWFFSMAQTGRILTGLKLQRGFGPKLPSTFSELKASYASVFDQVLESADSGRCRSAFRADADHSFRAMSISDSGGCRSLIPG